MLNEGAVGGDMNSAYKTMILREIDNLGRATPDQLERAVFEAATGASREDVDWEVEDNQAGYHTWLKAFDRMLTELVEDGYLASEKDGESAVLVPVPRDDDIGWSRPGPSAQVS